MKIVKNLVGILERLYLSITNKTEDSKDAYPSVELPPLGLTQACKSHFHSLCNTTFSPIVCICVCHKDEIL